MLYLSLLSPKGKGKEAVDYLKNLQAPPGIKIHKLCITFGRFDGMILFESPDEKTALQFALEVGFATDYIIETLSAVPVREL
jgi:uncharacterized protein with GYD domain